MQGRAAIVIIVHPRRQQPQEFRHPISEAFENTKVVCFDRYDGDTSDSGPTYQVRAIGRVIL
jgi:hypothetical protein